MDCAQCGALLGEGARFCGECGTAVARRCTGCDAELAPNLRFCEQCGTPVDSAAPAAAPVATAAVRKTVTVVFCDLGGSTRFGERTDAELAREVMARYHAILQDVIDAHRGTVAKFMGDGMMALFGTPEIAEDDATRAVRAGSEVQQRFTAFAAEVAARHGETLTLRVGVNTGEVVIAHGDADLIGDALNVAARLEKACRPGQVLVGEETWRLTRSEFGYEPLGAVSVAGRDQPVSVYELALDAASAGETVAPFVGRDTEMRRLLAVFEGAVAARSAQLATVLGSPGVGKTRLSRELCAHVELAAGAVTFEIRCDRAGDATFAPIASLIREATGLGDDADGPTARTAVASLLAEHEADRERLVDVLAGLVGAAPARSVEETFWAIRRLVESVAARQAMVVVIDDIQWAEPLLLDLLEHLAEWVHGVPVLLVCLARPELREVRPAFVETGRRVSEVLALDGLDSAATEQLAAGLLGTDRLPAGLIERLPASTDGNPLFVRELVRMLVDDRVIRQREGVWELTIDADAVEVPPTIQSLLATRVERLPNDERELLEFAAVVGAEFSLGALRELAGPDVSILSLLERMRRKELVEPTGTYWGDEPVHRFHHVLIRDAAYRRLLKTTRADLHERVGVWTDRTAAGLIGEHEAVIAYHYEQAYQYRRELGTTDDHVDDLGRRAAELLSIAANRALGRDDLAAAGALARRALPLLPEADIKARAELLLVGCECLLASGDVVMAAPLVEQLVEVAAGDAGLDAWAACFSAQLVGLTDPEALLAADATATAAAETLQRLDDHAGEAKAHQVRAGLLARLGRVGECELELDLALAAARGVDDRRRVTAVLGAAPNAALWGPSPVARAGGRCLDVVRLLRITTASPSVEATSMRCQAVLEAMRGRFDVSRQMIAASRSTLEELGLRHGLLETDLFAGMVELIAGDAAAAIGPLRAAYGGLGALGVGADAGQAAALLSRALLALGQVDEADQMATASENLAGQNLKTAIAWRVARAEVLAARGDIAAGIAQAEAAVEIAAATDYTIDHADACVALMGLRETAGDAVGARAARADAVRLYDAKGATVPAQRLSGTAVADEPTEARPTTSQQLASSRPVPGEARTPFADNRMWRQAERMVACFNVRDFDGARLVIAEGFERFDRRRSVSAPTAHGREAYIDAAVSWYEVGFEQCFVEPLAVRGDASMLARAGYRASDGREVVFLSVYELDAEGLIARGTHFDEDDMDAAIDELDARYLAGEGAAQASLLLASLAIAEELRRYDADAMRELMSPDFVMVDHSQLGFGSGDREYFIDANSSRALVSAEATSLLRAIRVERNAVLAVRESSYVTAHGSEYNGVACIILVVDSSNRICRSEWFDEAHYPDALARLHELAADRPAASVPSVLADHPVVKLVTTTLELMARGDWAAVGDLDGTAEDIERLDHRRLVSAPPLRGREAYGLNAFAFFDVFELVTAEPVAVRGERLALIRLHCGQSDGLQLLLLCLYECDADGRMVFEGDYDDEDLSLALAELDRRFAAGEGAPSPQLDNAASLQVRRAGVLAARHDPAEIERVGNALLADDVVRLDHRGGVAGLPLRGRAEIVRLFQETFAVFPVFTTETVAVRGERLAVMQLTMASNDGFGIRLVGLYELDTDGRLAFFAHYDEGDLGSALFELDRRYFVGEGAEHADMLQVCGAFTVATDRDDFDALRELMAPDFVMVDHTPLGFGIGDREHYIDVSRTRNQVSADGVQVIRTIDIVGHALLATTESSQITREGNEYGHASCIILLVDSSNQIARMEWFDDDHYAEALARLHVLAEPSGIELVNAVVRRLPEYNAAFAARDWERTAALYVADIVNDDRRSTVSSGVTVGRSEIIELVRGLADVGFTTVEQVPIAIRGERLALVRRIWKNADGLDLSLLSVMEIDEAGKFTRSVMWDDGNLAAAYDELDERYIAGEGAQYELQLRRGSDYRRAVDARDVDAIRALFAADAFVRNHRRIGWPMATADDLIERVSGDVGLAGVTSVSPFVEHRGDVSIALVERLLVTPEASEYTTVIVTVQRWSAGLLNDVEFFDPEDVAAARARFEELASESRAPRAIENAAWRAVHDLVRLHKAGQTEVAAEQLVARDMQHTSRRRVVSSAGWVGRDAFIEHAGAALQLFPEGGTEPIAVRGQHLVIARDRFSSENDFEMVMISVYETDAAGAVARWVTFDEDDLAAALDELDERYIAGEGADHAYVIRRLADQRHALDAKDWDAYAALLDPAFVLVDHRPIIGLGSGSRDTLLEALRAFDELAPNLSYLEPSFEVRGDVVLARTRDHATSTEGNQYEWEHFVVHQLAAGQLLRAELFPLDAYSEAHARFEALAAETRTPLPDNAASRLLVRGEWLSRHPRLAVGGIDLVAPDIVEIDHRRGVSAADIVGIEAWRANQRAVRELMGAARMEDLAVRGERLVLSRVSYTSSNQFDLVHLVVHEIDASGRLCRADLFDEEALTTALETLDSRYDQIRDDKPGSCERALVRDRGSFDRRDFGVLESYYAPGFTALDHRPMGFPPADLAQYLERSIALVEAAPALVILARKSYLAEHAAIMVTSFAGTSAEGSEYTWDLYFVAQTDAQDRFTRFEYFPDDQWPEALARFDELANE